MTLPNFALPNFALLLHCLESGLQLDKYPDLRTYLLTYLLTCLLTYLLTYCEEVTSW